MAYTNIPMPQTPEIRDIIIGSDTMINSGLHEDDDYYIITKPVHARVVGPQKDGGTAVIIPDIDPERILYYHQPDPPAKTA